jgi:hypothetical protein
VTLVLNGAAQGGLAAAGSPERPRAHGRNTADAGRGILVATGCVGPCGHHRHGNAARRAHRRENPALRAKINSWIRYLIRRTISPRRVEIGAFVTNVVEACDSTTLVNRLELQVTAPWSAAWSAS